VIRMRTYGMVDAKDALKGLHDELVALGANEARKTLTRAARKAMQPVRDSARANAPVDSGLTRDNIVIATQTAQQDGDGVVTVGLRIKRSKETRLSKHAVSKGGTHRMATSPHWRWHFIEGGTSSQSARPFLRPALDANASAVVANLGAELRKAIDRVLKKRARAATKGAK
jgi:HK97 gp10 family phage protein